MNFSLLRGKKIFLLDCDGVIWRDDTPIPGSIEAITQLQHLGSLYFLTNNSSYSPKDLQKKLNNFGLNVSLSSCLPVSVVTADVIRKKIPNKRKVFIIGEPGLKRTFLDQGFTLLNEEDNPRQAEIIVVGMDRHFTYENLKFALQALVLNDATFIATNTDPTLPTPAGPIPGAGAMVAALERCANKKPEMIIGKPNTYMFQHVMEQEKNQNLKEYVMIGDRLSTDIKFAKNIGITGVLVQSGAQEDISPNCSWMPDAVFSNLKELVEFLVEKDEKN